MSIPLVSNAGAQHPLMRIDNSMMLSCLLQLKGIAVALRDSVEAGKPVEAAQLGGIIDAINTTLGIVSDYREDHQIAALLVAAQSGEATS